MKWRRKVMPDAIKAAYDAKLTNNILASPEYQRAQRVMGYASLEEEVKTWPILRHALAEGKSVYLPRVEGKRLAVAPVIYHEGDFVDLSPAYRGILEPKAPGIDPGQLSLILVPGLAFDREGFRIGYGGGYYDRLLEEVGDRVVSMGICYSFQMCRRLPRMSHDVPVSRMMTERGRQRILRPN